MHDDRLADRHKTLQQRMQGRRTMYAKAWRQNQSSMMRFDGLQERRSLDKSHRIPRLALLHEVVDRHDAGMLKPAVIFTSHKNIRRL